MPNICVDGRLAVNLLILNRKLRSPDLSISCLQIEEMQQRQGWLFGTGGGAGCELHTAKPPTAAAGRLMLLFQ